MKRKQRDPEGHPADLHSVPSLPHHQHQESEGEEVPELQRAHLHPETQNKSHFL